MSKRRIDRRYFYLTGILFIVATILGFSSLKNMDEGSAADGKNFDPGYIISDDLMGDYVSMTEREIYDFMKSKNSCNDTNIAKASWYPSLSYHIENGHFVCLADEKFDGETSAHIIWQAAQDYRINPKVLIVLLEKEQGLITDTWPNSTLQYRSATGYGCPDTDVCDSQYYGFKNQVRNSAKFFRKNLDGDPNWTNYPVGINNVLYCPNYACGTKTIDIKNRATGALYTYTPYTPNDAALAAGYGLGDDCSAYGNRNFWMLYTDWFGDTKASTPLAHATDGIKKAYKNVSGEATLGKEVGNISSNPATGIYWQQYESGFIVGKDGTGYYVSMGKIRDVWVKFGLEAGTLGFPMGNIESNPTTGITWQQYEKGFIVGNDAKGYYISVGKIRDTWARLGLESGTLGFPKGNIESNPTTGIIWQQYEKGFIVGKDSTGYYISQGMIRDAWIKNGLEAGKLGFPVGDIEANKTTGIYWQQYQGGFIVGKDATGYYVSSGKIRDVWAAQGFEGGTLGFPIAETDNNPSTGIYWQQYEKGFVVGKDSTGYYISIGKIRDVWVGQGCEGGSLGFPVGNIDKNTQTGMYWQQYQGGFIVGNDAKGYYVSQGKIREIWAEQGFEGGRLGFPTSGIIYHPENATYTQNYEHGAILYDTRARQTGIIYF
ncbi:hypothetical protein IKF94_02050 [Candidatus Saccharibacteria bacterium]|nr:hypothetical protein [Candidatus Saccharibacteria bacterium]